MRARSDAHELAVLQNVAGSVTQARSPTQPVDLAAAVWSPFALTSFGS
jgi:hypothetical protein